MGRNVTPSKQKKSQSREVSVQVTVQVTEDACKGPARPITTDKNKKAKAKEEAQVRVGVKREQKKKWCKVRPVNMSGDGQAADGDSDWKKKRVAAEKRAEKHIPKVPFDHIFISTLTEKPQWVLSDV